MPQIIKPSNLSLTWASGGDVLNPGDTKYATGWQVEIPPRQWFNYLDNRQDTAIAHINQHGVAVWDAATEYQEDKSYAQGPTNGTIYRSVQTNTNQNPETDVTNTYWIVAFAGAGDFYTKAESEDAFLGRAANGSDIVNAATFRGNISVYSQAQTYTRSEVDAKTTVASTLQAQQQTSNTVLLSALRLAEAFKGSNQSLGLSGFQKLPGGLIVQWGLTAAAVPNVPASVTLPITFPTACMSVQMTYVDSEVLQPATRGAPVQVCTYGATSFQYSYSGSTPAAQHFWVALGY